jgi:signal transduction histidine kinase
VSRGMARVVLRYREPGEEAMAGASLSIDHHRLLTRLTTAKLAIQLLERRSDLSPEQRRLVRLAIEAVDGLSADIRDHWGHSLAEAPPTVAEASTLYPGPVSSGGDPL